MEPHAISKHALHREVGRCSRTLQEGLVTGRYGMEELRAFSMQLSLSNGWNSASEGILSVGFRGIDIGP